MANKILIAVPIGAAGIEPACFRSIWGQRRDDDSEYLFNYYEGYDVRMARDKAVEDAIAMKCTHIFFVDSDIELPVDALSKLLKANHYIAYGWYPRKRTTTGQTEVFKEDGEPDFVDRNNMSIEEIVELEQKPYIIKGGGLGIALIRTDVFKWLREKGRHPFEYVRYSYPDGTTKGSLSEDNFFATQVSDHFEIVLLPRVRGFHIVKQWT